MPQWIKTLVDVNLCLDPKIFEFKNCIYMLTCVCVSAYACTCTNIYLQQRLDKHYLLICGSCWLILRVDLIISRRTFSIVVLQIRFDTWTGSKLHLHFKRGILWKRIEDLSSAPWKRQIVVHVPCDSVDMYVCECWLKPSTFLSFYSCLFAFII